MKIPLYSNLKAKLESKGLDPIISGQVAWFSSSIIYGIVCALFLKFCNFISGIELLFFGLSIVLFLSFLYKSTLIISFYRRMIYFLLYLPIDTAKLRYFP